VVAELVGVGFGLGETVGEAVGFGVGLGVGETVGEAVGLGVGFGVGETVGDAVGFGVGETVGDAVGFGVGETVGGVTTGTVPRKVKSSKTPVGVFSKEASTAVAGAVPATGILLAKKSEAEIKPGPSPFRVPN